MITAEEETELVKKAQAGDTKAAQELVLKHRWLILLILDAQPPTPHREDLVQEGIEALYRALRRFDLSRGYRFGTYAQRWIRLYIQQYMKEERQYVPMDPDDTVEPTYLIDSELECNHILDVLYELVDESPYQLTDRQKAILVLRIQDDISQKKAAKLMGMSPLSVGNLEDRIKLQLKRKLKNG